MVSVSVLGRDELPLASLIEGVGVLEVHSMVIPVAGRSQLSSSVLLSERSNRGNVGELYLGDVVRLKHNLEVSSSVSKLNSVPVVSGGQSVSGASVSSVDNVHLVVAIANVSEFPLLSARAIIVSPHVNVVVTTVT